MKTLRLYLTTTAVLACGPVVATTETDMATEAELMRAIALYPEEVRTAVLEVAQHPALFVKVQVLQRRSSGRFDALLSGLHRFEQEAIWELVRHPGLIDALVGAGGHLADIDRVLADYPESVRETSREYAEYDLELLAEIQRLNGRTEAAFRRLLAENPARVRSAARTLIEQPELIAVLEEDMAATVLVGEAYRNDPGGTLARLDELGLEATHESASRLVDTTQRGVPDATPADTPFADVAAVYQSRYAYDDPAPIEMRDEEVVDVTWYPPRPYPYWYGYPRWYAGAGGYASLNWYLTPRFSASLGFNSPVYAPRLRHPGSFGYGPYRSIRPVRVVYRPRDGHSYDGPRPRQRGSRRGPR